LLRLPDLLDRDVAEAGVADEARLAEAGDRPELLIERDRRIGAMQLPQIDALDPEAAEAHMHLLLQVFGLADRGPFVRAAADQAALGRDMHLRIGHERFSDQLFGDVWPVAVSRVDEVDAELRHAAQGALALLRILRRPPDALAGDAHGTEPEAVDIHVAANGECSRTGGIGCGHGKTPRISIAT